MTPSPTLTVEKEMAYTHADFFRLLPKALATDAYTVTGSHVVMEGSGGRRLEITLGPEGERRIALLRMPATKVTLTFTGYPATEAEAALAAFDRSYQRGGG